MVIYMSKDKNDILAPDEKIVKITEGVEGPKVFDVLIKPFINSIRKKY